MKQTEPSRGEVWLVDLNPIRGHEQAGTRPALVVSTDVFNHGPAELAVVAPMTTRRRGVPLHVEVTPPEGGVRQASFVQCENLRSVAVGRLVERWGRVSRTTLSLVEDRLRILLEL